MSYPKLLEYVLLPCYNERMKTNSPKNIIWHVRIDPEEAEKRAELATLTGETESQIDRRLWDNEYQRVMEENNDSLLQDSR